MVRYWMMRSMPLQPMMEQHLFVRTIDRVIESGHDPRRFTSDMLERIRDLMIVDALKDSTAKSILRDMPDDQMERMRNQANRIGTANLQERQILPRRV